MPSVGKLGLPLITASPTFPAMLQYHIATFSTFHGLEQSNDLVRSRFETLCQDDRIKALEGIKISTGLAGTTFDARRLIAWWAWRANTAGIQQADADLNAYLNSDQIEVLVAHWLYGISVSETVNLTERIKLIPISQLPDSNDKQNALFSDITNAFSQSLPKCVIAQLISVSKVYSDTDIEIESATRHALWDAALLLNVMPKTHCSSGYATEYIYPHTPPGPLGAYGGSKPIVDVQISNICGLSQETANDFEAIFDRLSKLPENWKRKVDACLRRLAQCKGRSNDSDRALDLGIALEMLLLDSEHGGVELPGQLNAHFRTRGAWLLGDSFEERERVYSVLGNIYMWRSQVAHTGSLTLKGKKKETFNSDFAEALEIAERLVKELICSGPPGDWKQIVLGANSDGSKSN